MSTHPTPLRAMFNAPKLSVRHQGVKPRFSRLRPKGIKPRFGYLYKRRFSPRAPKPKR